MALRPNIQRVEQDSLTTAQTQKCAHCQTMSRCRRRDFSQQAWAVLLVWEEVQKSTVDQSLCDDCYNELRETLIDRTDEIESALNTDTTEKVVAVQKKSGAKKGRKVSKLAS